MLFGDHGYRAPVDHRPQTTHSNAPAYIFNMLQQVSTLQRQTNLRFATNSDLLILRTRLLLSELALAYRMLYTLTSRELPLY